jgi:hypothetical protein
LAALAFKLPAAQARQPALAAQARTGLAALAHPAPGDRQCDWVPLVH